MSPLARKCDGRLGFPILIVRRSNIQNVILPPDWYCCTGVHALSLTGKEVLPMLTIEGLIAVISLALTAFGLGYAIGRNSKTQE